MTFDIFDQITGNLMRTTASEEAAIEAVRDIVRNGGDVTEYTIVSIDRLGRDHAYLDGERLRATVLAASAARSKVARDGNA
jgi:hypothetical protein